MAIRNVRHQGQAGIFQQVFWICVLVHIASAAPKIRYASEKECDRYSLDAVYYERFKPITENIFKDSQEFVNRISDLMAESLTSIMASLPDRDSSDDSEKKLFNQFKALKTAFSSRMKKTQKKISMSWEALVANHFDLMYDNGKTTLKEYLNKTQNMTDSYSESRKTLDSSMESFVGFVKGTVRDGLQGISLAANDVLKREEASKNTTEEDKSKEEENDTKSREDKLLEKKVEIAEMIVQGFLGKVTIEVIKKKMDLFKKVTIDPEDRESVLDDLLFDILMIKNRIRAIIHDDIPSDKGNIDLARRSVYTYWADMAEKMYKDKMSAKQSKVPGGDTFYKKLWSDENQLADTLLSLMEVYS
ncbi:uncharacterized protein TNCT_334221 [Trichonephila clavata]|uniref:Uncharacterized protein n=1 Tax=Trichonephila clavata TaxID=2740835 RepID=A0A8X6H9S8_TRICU|nr:uncharacterized protein TNCT_334221 [Trichonephila clavata]